MYRLYGFTLLFSAILIIISIIINNHFIYFLFELFVIFINLLIGFNLIFYNKKN